MTKLHKDFEIEAIRLDFEIKTLVTFDHVTNKLLGHGCEDFTQHNVFIRILVLDYVISNPVRPTSGLHKAACTALIYITQREDQD